jgi:aspartyl protease family protein
MLRFAALAAVGAISAAGAAQTVVMLSGRDQGPELRRAETAVSSPKTDDDADTAAEVTKSSDGHYWAEAQVNGQAVKFLVDTGATAVALTEEDAQRLGLDTMALKYRYQVTTASGQIRAAPVKLASVSVAGARVTNVDALVIEKGLSTSLLGMSYLGRLSRFEATPRALILRP